MVRIGVLHDFPTPDGGTAFERAARAGLRRSTATGRLDPEVEFVHAAAMGLPLPGGSAHSVEQAFAELADQGVVAVLGPSISDNAIVASALVDAARIPVVNYSGSEETRSEYSFQFQIGSLEEEPSLLAEHLMARGLTQVAIVRDRSYVGRRMGEFFEDAAAVHGLALVDRSRAEALVSLGMWAGAQDLAREEPSVPVVGNSALIYGYYDQQSALGWEGWAYPDTVHEDNGLYRELGVVGAAVAGQYDLGCLIGEGLARARLMSGPAVRDGLERVKAIPTATGEPGTVMGFGRHDRAALKGRYLVVRSWREGRSTRWQ